MNLIEAINWCRVNHGEYLYCAQRAGITGEILYMVNIRGSITFLIDGFVLWDAFKEDPGAVLMEINNTIWNEGEKK